MTLRDYLTLLQRGWWVVAATTLLGIGLATLATLTAVPTYSAEAAVVVTASDGAGSSGQERQSGFAIGWASTYAALVSSDAVIDRAAAASGDDAHELREAVSATARTDTSIIDIGATASDPQRAAQRADIIADTLVSQSALTAPPSAGGTAGTIQLVVVSRADVPQDPTSPRLLNNIAIGTIIGLAIGVGALIVFQSLDTRIHSAAELPRGARLATVTSLPAKRARPARSTPAVNLRLEAFRHLRAHLMLTNPAGGCIAVAGVTSASDANGMVDQLAQVLSEVGLNVLVVNADLHVPSATRRRGMTSDGAPAGLADVLAGTASLADVIDPGMREGVSVISAGSVRGSSAQLLTTASMGEVLDQLRSKFAFVLLACPPVTERSESAVVAARSGISLVVVESGMTRRAELRHALDLIEGVGLRAPIVAIDHVPKFEPVRDVGNGPGRHASNDVV